MAHPGTRPEAAASGPPGDVAGRRRGVPSVTPGASPARTTRVSMAGLVDALQRLQEIRALGASRIDLSAVPPVRVDALARFAAAARAQAIARMPPPRRQATLLAFAKVQETAALDDVVDLLDQLITAMLGRVERAGQQRRLRTLKDLDVAALLLHEACLVLLDPGCADRGVRNAVFARVSRDQLTQAVAQVADLIGTPDDHYFEDLRSRYSQVRRFLPALQEAVEFAATDAGRPVTEAFRFLKTIEGQKRPDMSQAPRDLLTPAWQRVVIGSEGRIDRQLYTFCVLERLQDGLRRRDLFVPASRRWGDPHAKLLQGPAWEKVRSRVCRTLGRSPTAAGELESLGKQLDEAYRRTANNLPTNSAVTIERAGRRDVLTLTPLDKLDEPASLVELRRDVTTRLPRVDLTEVLLEVLAWTNFAAEFRHVSEGDARVGDLDLSLCAVLLAEACNIGLEPLVRPDVPALTRGRLSWVQQNYVRAETHHQGERPAGRLPGPDPPGDRLGAAARSPRPTACGSSSRSAPSTPARTRSTSTPAAASPTTTSPATSSPASTPSSCRARSAIPCSSSRACWSNRPAFALTRS